MNIADIYLCNEIATIDRTLDTLSKTIIGAGIVGPYQKPFKPIIHIKPVSSDPEIHRRDVITQTLDVLQILQKNPSHSLSLQQGGWGLVNLCIGLYQIGHYTDAVVIGVWAVKLFRILVDTDANAYHPYLALALHNLSHYHHANGNQEEALDSLSRCLEIGRILEKEDPTPEVRGLHIRSLLSSAKIFAAVQDHDRSYEESREAVEICEDILFQTMNRKLDDPLKEVDASPDSRRDIVQHGMNLQLHTWLSAQMSSDQGNDVALQTLHGYGQALHQVSCSLHHLGRFLEAIAADTKALQVFRLITINNPTLFEIDIADILSNLTCEDFRVFIPSATSMAYIAESILIHRRLVVNGSLYNKSLYDALYRRATMLRSMERYVEEVQAWQEVATQGRSMENDLLVANALYQMSWSLRHLHRLKDAIASRMDAVKAYRSAFKGPSQLEANAHYELAVDLELADLTDQARVSAQEAVDQYRILVLTGHESFTEALADSLTLLANISLRTLEFDQALEKGGEALMLYQSIASQTQDSDITSKYADCLDINMTAAFESYDEERAVERGCLVVQLFEDLVVDNTDGAALGLVGSWETYAHLLNKHDRLADARPWIEKAIDWYKTNSVGGYQAGYIAALCIYGSILDDQGFLEQALGQVVTAVNAAKECVTLNPSLVPLYCVSNAHQIDHLIELGRYGEALAISRDMVAYVRQGQLSDPRDIIDCFLVHATALNFNGEHEAAISISNEVITLSNAHLRSISSQVQRDKEQVQLAHAFHILSESLADRGRENEALGYARQCVDQMSELQARLPAFRSPRMQYVRALFSTNLACRLAAAGDYPASIALLTEVKAFYENSVHNRHGYHIELARVLRLLGLFHCAHSQHEEGIAALVSLINLRKRLMETTPDLARYVEIHLQHEDQRPSWLKPLHSKLECSHHPSLSAFLSSLFSLP